MKNIIKSVGMAALVGVAVTACDLEMLPLNEVVLESYWKDKNDVENVLRSCYVGMQEGGWVTKAIVWGEVRSDNISVGEVDVPQYLRDIIKGNLKQTNSACDWGPMYSVINRCNTVIYYAPKVAEEDPNFTPSDLAITLAEAKAIRALNYFYLIRTFNHVPFTFEPSIDDQQVYQIPASRHEVILDSLIMDIESCKDDPLRRYTSITTDPNYKKNTGRITRVAMYALLADMYLWRASDAKLDAGRQQQYYRRAIECCDYIMQYKKQEYKEDADGTLNRKMDTYVLQNYDYPLLAEQSATGGVSGGPAAYNAIFGTGNSWEGLFEITYGDGDSDLKNTDVAYTYGGYNNEKPEKYVQYTAASKEALMPMPLTAAAKTYNDKELFSVTTDYRSLTGFQYSESGSFPILKYVTRQFYGNQSSFGTATSTDWSQATNSAKNIVRSAYIMNTENWIVYRLSDILLMRAEAEIQLAGMLNPAVEIDNSAADTKIASEGNVLQTPEELYQDAFNLISAVYMRSNPDAQKGGAESFRPKLMDYTKYDDFVTLLENERHRELLFEGKRYYDLVRRARREGNTTHFASAVSSKFGQASKMVLIQMAKMDFMYMPYAEAQLKVNPNLRYDETSRQNPAYPDEKETTQN